MSRCKGCNACGFDTKMNFIEELGIFLCCKCENKPCWKEKIEQARMIIEEKSEMHTDERRLKNGLY